MQSIKPLGDSVRTSLGKLEFGDALLLVYLLALIRQYSWPVTNNVLAWSLALLFALVFWCLGISRRESYPLGAFLSPSFYLIIALPLFGIFAIRFVFPDVSFDVLNYHLIAAERSLTGYPFRPDDFFPIDFPVNPMPDMVTGIYRHILGYRGGTIVNLLTLIWTAIILVKFLRPYLKRTWLLYVSVLLLLLNETLLFEINNYMVDLLAVPLMLQATYLVLNVREPRTIGYDQFYIALLLGLSVAFKLTNVTYVIPIVLVWAQRVRADKVKLNPIPLMLLLLIFLIPSIPHTVHIFRETGSPVYPLYNNLFRSPYWTIGNFEEPNFGPAGLGQALVWPLLLYTKISRISQLPVYAGRIPFGFILAFLYLPFRRVERNIRALSFIMISGSILWSLTTGATRYASFLELISGMLVIYLFQFVIENLKTKEHLRLAFSLVPWGILAALSYLSLRYVNHYEWSLRPTLFYDYRAYLRESRFIFRDYSLKSFLSSDTAALVADVDVWIKTLPLMSCFEGLLKPEAPAIGLRSFVSFQTQESRDRFATAIDKASNKRMFSLCKLTDVKPAVELITRRGLGIGKISTLYVPYYSYNTVFELALIEVLPSAAKESREGSLSFSRLGGPLPDAAFQAGITPHGLPASVNAGSKTTIYLTVENRSAVVWPQQGGQNGPYTVSLGNHWLNSNGTVVTGDDGRTGLPFDLKPGDKIELPLTITAPEAPGNYILEFDMVQEQVIWFSGMGSKTARTSIKVE